MCVCGGGGGYPSTWVFFWKIHRSVGLIALKVCRACGEFFGNFWQTNDRVNQVAGLWLESGTTSYRFSRKSCFQQRYIRNTIHYDYSIKMPKEHTVLFIIEGETRWRRFHFAVMSSFLIYLCTYKVGKLPISWNCVLWPLITTWNLTKGQKTYHQLRRFFESNPPFFTRLYCA